MPHHHEHNAGAVIDVFSRSSARSNGPGAWSNSVGDAFLQPYDLNADKSTVTADGTKGPIHHSLQQLPNTVKVYKYQAQQDAQTEGNAPRQGVTANHYVIAVNAIAGGSVCVVCIHCSTPHVTMP